MTCASANHGDPCERPEACPVCEPAFVSQDVALHHGDCLDVLRGLPDASVDAVVTDPPYGLEFMGKEWDRFKVDRRQPRDLVANESPHRRTSTGSGVSYGVGGSYGGDGLGAMRAFQQWCEQWAAECLRVLKPGGHMLAFGGTRTFHRLACAVEDAGFEIRDSIAWLYGSGFPKSLDLSKALDKAAGAEREVVGPGINAAAKARHAATHDPKGGATYLSAPDGPMLTAPATDAARKWAGFGTALKPAHEPIVVARKPLSGTVAGNVQAWGTGALNVDGCRVGTDGGGTICTNRDDLGNCRGHANAGRSTSGETVHGPDTQGGRWPANVVLDEDSARRLDEQSGDLTSGGGIKAPEGKTHGFADGRTSTRHDFDKAYDGDSGGASRFFYIAREDSACSDDASTGTSGPTTPEPSADGAWSSAAPVERLTSTRFRYIAKADASERVRVNGTAHPTVKPLALMRWLVRLVTPPGGTVLEPFAGSGTTVEACLLEGFRCIAIEREADYLPLIRQRIDRRRDPVQAVKATGDDGGLFDLLNDDGEGAA